MNIDETSNNFDNNYIDNIDIIENGKKSFKNFNSN
jgi:hypothetical protein